MTDKLTEAVAALSKILEETDAAPDDCAAVRTFNRTTITYGHLREISRALQGKVLVPRAEIDWIIRNLDAPEKAARSKYRGIEAIKYVATRLIAEAEKV
ncbi:MAG: hypothetical protein RJA98_685 [Pseudomonadota bacterium]|jgi:hypothetical protein